MAEIKIEKKKPIWPWILAALAVLLILFLIFNDSGEEAVETATETEEVENEYATEDTTDTFNTSDNTNNEVSNYVTYVRTDSEDRMGLNHTYTETALDRLVSAVQARAEETNVNVDDEMERIDGVRNYITEDKYETQHADSIKVAFQQIATSIGKIQQSEEFNKNVDVQGLKDRADNLKAGQLTLNQKDAVHAYFDKAADVLQEMDENRNRERTQNQGQNNNTTAQGENRNMNQNQNQ